MEEDNDVEIVEPPRKRLCQRTIEQTFTPISNLSQEQIEDASLDPVETSLLNTTLVHEEVQPETVTFAPNATYRSHPFAFGLFTDRKFEVKKLIARGDLREAAEWYFKPWLIDDVFSLEKLSDLLKEQRRAPLHGLIEMMVKFINRYFTVFIADKSVDVLQYESKVENGVRKMNIIKQTKTNFLDFWSEEYRFIVDKSDLRNSDALACLDFLARKKVLAPKLVKDLKDGKQTSFCCSVMKIWFCHDIRNKHNSSSFVPIDPGDTDCEWVKELDLFCLNQWQGFGYTLADMKEAWDDNSNTNCLLYNKSTLSILNTLNQKRRLRSEPGSTIMKDSEQEPDVFDKHELGYFYKWDKDGKETFKELYTRVRVRDDFLDFMLALKIFYGNNDDSVFLTFLSYWADVLRNGKTRPTYSGVVFGLQGSGKSWFFDNIMTNVLGSAFLDVKSEDVFGTFTANIDKRRVLVLSENDVNPTMIEAIKQFITQLNTRVRNMHTDTVYKPATAVLWICCNGLETKDVNGKSFAGKGNQLFTEHERRFYFIPSPTKYINKQDFWTAMLNTTRGLLFRNNHQVIKKFLWYLLRVHEINPDYSRENAPLWRMDLIDKCLLHRKDTVEQWLWVCVCRRSLVHYYSQTQTFYKKEYISHNNEIYLTCKTMDEELNEKEMKEIRDFYRKEVMWIRMWQTSALYKDYCSFTGHYFQNIRPKDFNNFLKSVKLFFEDVTEPLEKVVEVSVSCLKEWNKGVLNHLDPKDQEFHEWVRLQNVSEMYLRLPGWSCFAKVCTKAFNMAIPKQVSDSDVAAITKHLNETQVEFHSEPEEPDQPDSQTVYRDGFEVDRDYTSKITDEDEQNEAADEQQFSPVQLMEVDQ